MTYKNSNWTRGELGNVPDRNPPVPCVVCGKDYYLSYWKEQYGTVTNETTLRCESCWAQLIEDARTERRKANNNQLTEWCK